MLEEIAETIIGLCYKSELKYKQLILLIITMQTNI